MGTGKAIIRAATGADLAALRDAGLAAMNWTGEDRFTLEEYVSQPKLARYLEGWPRSGDFGVVAESAEGTPVGAAWCRVFEAADAGYGFVDEHTPELTIGVLADHRGTGIGTALMQGLIAEGSSRAVPAISLSVEDGNKARVLYERLGFRKVGRNGGSDTLLLKLGPA